MRSLPQGHLKAGLDAVRHAKLRSFWTCLGIIIGVASVISVVALGEGIKRQIGGQIHHLGPDLISIRPAQIRAGEGSASDNASLLSGFSVSGPLSFRDIATVASTPGVNASAPLTIIGGTPKGDNGVYKGGFVIGTSPDLPELLNQPLSSGIFIANDQADQGVAVLGHKAAEAMFDVDVPLGRSFSFRGQEFIVQGIFEPFAAAPLSQQANLDNAVFIPNSVAESLTHNTAPTYEILATANDPAQTDTVATAFRQALDKSHGGESGLTVQNGRDNLEANNEILDLLTRLIAGVAAISLLVGGVGIMNVMLVSVAERMHEIGIRKALGATNRQILSQFLVESGLLSLVGGILGIAVAGLISGGLVVFTDLRPVISWQIVVIATGVSLAVGVIFGTVPALKAARRDPIEALRSE